MVPLELQSSLPPARRLVRTGSQHDHGRQFRPPELRGVRRDHRGAVSVELSAGHRRAVVVRAVHLRGRQQVRTVRQSVHGCRHGSCGASAATSPRPARLRVSGVLQAVSVSACRAASPAHKSPAYVTPRDCPAGAEAYQCLAAIRFRRPARPRRRCTSSSPPYRPSTGIRSACRIASWATARRSFRKPTASRLVVPAAGIAFGARCGRARHATTPRKAASTFSKIRTYSAMTTPRAPTTTTPTTRCASPNHRLQVYAARR